MIIIKREKDRKYYDSHLKKYISLKEIFKYLKSEIDIKVINPSNQDITSETKIKALIKYSEKDEKQILTEKILGQNKNLSIKLFTQAFNRLKDSHKIDPNQSPLIMGIYLDAIACLR